MTMPKYIDAEKIEYDKHERIGLGIDYGLNENDIYYTTTKEKIDAIPAADVVEVVSCKDCKHNPLNIADDACPFVQEGGGHVKHFPEDDGFCKWGEKREDD